MFDCRINILQRQVAVHQNGDLTSLGVAQLAWHAFSGQTIDVASSPAQIYQPQNPHLAQQRHRFDQAVAKVQGWFAS